MLYYQRQLNMLSTRYRLELTDICCRMMTNDGVPVTLKERIWMNKLCDNNPQAKFIADSLLYPYKYESLD